MNCVMIYSNCAVHENLLELDIYDNCSKKVLKGQLRLAFILLMIRR